MISAGSILLSREREVVVGRFGDLWDARECKVGYVSVEEDSGDDTGNEIGDGAGEVADDGAHACSLHGQEHEEGNMGHGSEVLAIKAGYRVSEDLQGEIGGLAGPEGGLRSTRVERGDDD
ncbi:hypothetical protein L7F22_028307, partial [Adiantum nelumboides]|nr:hypothetical protein [Adiantum nelumboides]